MIACLPPCGSQPHVPRALSFRVRLGGVVLTTVSDGWLQSYAALALHLGSGVDDSGTALCRRAETWQTYPSFIVPLRMSMACFRYVPF